MKAKSAKSAKTKIEAFQNRISEPEIKPEVTKEPEFEKSRALNKQEIEDLKDQLEDLNQQNTTGG